MQLFTCALFYETLIRYTTQIRGDISRPIDSHRDLQGRTFRQNKYLLMHALKRLYARRSKSFLAPMFLAFLWLLLSGGRTAAFAWPDPYNGQALKTVVRKLVSFGNGNKAGGLSIKTSDGSERLFSTSLGMTWNKHRISCSSMPSSRDRSSCADWPKSIVPNKTTVQVTYFVGTDHGPGAPTAGIAKDVSAMPSKLYK